MRKQVSTSSTEVLEVWWRYYGTPFLAAYYRDVPRKAVLQELLKRGVNIKKLNASSELTNRRELERLRFELLQGTAAWRNSIRKKGWIRFWGLPGWEPLPASRLP